MKGLRTLGILALALIPAGELIARGTGDRHRVPFRWTGNASWEFFQSTGDRAGTKNTFDSLRQKYSVDLSGFLWDPRINQFSLGLDLNITDQDNQGVKQDTDGIGYRFQSTVFPNSPIPLRLYARRADTELTGVALASADRETAAWGAQLDLVNSAWSRFHMRYGRSSYDIQSPLVFQERRDTAILDFAKKIRGNDFTFRYDLYDNEERVNRTEMNRHNFYLTDLKRFRNGATLNLNAHYQNSQSLFSNGNRDALNTSRMSTRFDLPRGDKNRIGFSYDFLDTDGMFLDSTSHIANANGRFWLGRGFSSTGSFSYGQIRSSTASGDIDQTLVGIGTGLDYRKEWKGSTLDASYSLSYDDTQYNIGLDRQFMSHQVGVGYRHSVTADDEFFTSLSYSLDDNDTTGLGYSRDEIRLTAGWEGRLQGQRRYRASARYRDSVYDTFQFGLQKSDEIGLEGSLNFLSGGISLALATSDGVSDFVPDPSGVGPFLPGTDLVSKSDVASVGIHWRFLRNLRFHMQARNESRKFTTTGGENILSYHPQIDYNFYTWQFSAGYSYYQRSNGTEFTDDTFLLKVTKRFF